MLMQANNVNEEKIFYKAYGTSKNRAIQRRTSWMEVGRMDLKKCNISKNFAQDRLE